MKNFSRNLLFRILILIRILWGRQIARKLILAITAGEEFAFWQLLYCPEIKQPENVGFILLPGICSWSKCTMCGFQQGVRDFTQGVPFSSQSFILMFRLGQLMIAKTRKIIIFTGGSFLDLPLAAQQKIFAYLQKDKYCQYVAIESRAELITNNKIKALKGWLGNKQLEVAIGLETQDDVIRQKCINKGFSRADYLQALKILKEQGVRVSTYVFLKPMGLSEKQAIDEAIKTIKFAFQSGSDAVGLESAFVQPGTKMAQAYQAGKYQPPWLWSIIAVLKETHFLGHILIGNFENEYPMPLAIPKNCPNCSENIYGLLKDQRQKPDFSLLDNLKCACQEIWRKQIDI